MDTVKSFKGYGKVDPLEEQGFRRETRKRMIILVVSFLLLLALIVGVVAGTAAQKKGKNDDNARSTLTSPPQSLKAMCSVTANPESCYSSISSVDDANSTTDPQKLFRLSLQVVLYSLEKLSALPQQWIDTTSDPQLKNALGVCQTLFGDAIDSTNDSISLFTAKDGQSPLSPSGISNLRTWLSTTLTNLETCVDALVEMNATNVDMVKTAMSNSTQFASNSLAIATKFLAFLDKFNIPTNRKLLETYTGVDSSSEGLPSWVRTADRKLLQTSDSPKPDLTVAQDGSGNCKSINEALEKVPKRSKTRFVIYIKAGIYKEKVTVDKTMWNVMMFGDGMDKTIVTYDDNYVDGTRTLLTATFAALGKGFIAKNMGFQNYAGAAKHQAVAMRSTSDESVFFQCSFDGFQDTLYAHSNRQFYSQCKISGTVDFIFGNGAVIFQNCNIMPRQPLPYQFVTITAQGKTDPNQNTGTNIQNCIISPLDNVTVDVYLGRPWKNYATTVFMKSTIGGILNPQGWTEWFPDVVPPNTIFYAEYQNKGPGANVAKRVTWAGYKSSLTASQAAEFTAGSFIDGQSWIPAAQVKFT